MTTHSTTDMTPGSPGTTGQRGPLSGIRVLDASPVYAAPITAMLLGDYGADMIKVETSAATSTSPVSQAASSTVLPTAVVPRGVEGLAVTPTLTPALVISSQTFRLVPL
jgi:hypothetical protein